MSILGGAGRDGEALARRTSEAIVFRGLEETRRNVDLDVCSPGMKQTWWQEGGWA